jgi:hypothetical protein
VSALADVIAAVHEARGPLPAGEVATDVRRRKAVVLDVYRSHPDRFVHTGKTKASLWDVRRPSFDTLRSTARYGSRINARATRGREWLNG